MGRRLTLGSEAGVLLLLSAIAVVFFFLTTLAVRSYRARERQLAKEWSAKGHEFLRASQPARAVEAFQTSLRFGPEAQDVHYAMVDSLLAAGRWEQAQSYLLSLWEQQPANGILNLDLARIAAARNDVPTATRYYHNAIYGVWDSSAQPHRTQARLELIRFLLKRNAQREAKAELVALAANAPASPQLSREIGSLFLEAGDADSAFDQLASASKANPHDADLLADAGKAAFLQGRYDISFGYLDKARLQHNRDPETERLFELTRLILENDPFDRRVSWQTRSSRALAALAQADVRLQQCAAQLSSTPGGPPAQITDLLGSLEDSRKRGSVAAMRRDPDLLTRYSGLAFAAEESAARFCGAPQGFDEALWLIGRRRPEATP